MNDLSPRDDAKKYWLLALLLAAAVFAAVAPTLKWPQFTGGNEYIVAQTAREVRRGGPVLVPQMLGEPRVKKPPLVAWITAATLSPQTIQQLDATNESQRDAAYRDLAWQVRWTGLFAGCVLILATFEAARLLLGGRFALAAAAVVATTFLFQKYMRQSTSDAHLAVWVAVANAAFLHGLVRGRWWLATIIGSIATGLAFLCKGPVALLETVLPLAVLLVWRNVGATPASSAKADRRSTDNAGVAPTDDAASMKANTDTAALVPPPPGEVRWGRRASNDPESTMPLAAPTQPPPGREEPYQPLAVVARLLLGVVLFAAVAVPWFAHVYRTVPGVWSTWFSEVTREGATDLEASNPAVYLRLIPLTWPWVIFGFVGLIALFKRYDEPGTAGLARRRLGRLAWWPVVQIAVPLLVMVWFRDRKERYMLPMVMPAAVLCAIGLKCFFEAWAARLTWAKIALSLHAVAVVVVCVGFPLAGAMTLKGPDGQAWYPVKLAVWMSVAFAALLGLGAIVVRRKIGAIVAFTVIAMLALQAVYAAGRGAVSELKALADLIRRDAPNAVVHDYGPTGRRVDEETAIYLGRPITFRDPATLTPGDQPVVYLIRQDRRDVEAKNDPKPPPGWHLLGTAKDKRNVWWAFVLPADGRGG